LCAPHSSFKAQYWYAGFEIAQGEKVASEGTLHLPRLEP